MRQKIWCRFSGETSLGWYILRNKIQTPKPGDRVQLKLNTPMSKFDSWKTFRVVDTEIEEDPQGNIKVFVIEEENR